MVHKGFLAFSRRVEALLTGLDSQTRLLRQAISGTLWGRHRQPDWGIGEQREYHCGGRAVGRAWRDCSLCCGAGHGGPVTSIASAMSNLPVLYRVTRNVSLTRGLVLKTTAIGILGVAVPVLQYELHA